MLPAFAPVLNPWPLFQQLRSLAVLVLVTTFLGGCVVHPQVIQRSEVLDQATMDREILAAEQQAPDGPVSLYEAMAWAIRYNRERRVRILESALAQQQFDLAEFDMLPKLTAQAGYTGRDPESASFSESIQTGNVSLEPSTSQDKARTTADATFTWNMLDFGLSYIRAKQQADRHLIALEKERKAVQILLRDVRKAWWEALSAQRLLKKIAPLADKVERSLEKARRIETARLKKPMEALGYQRSLLQILRTLQALRQELGGAKTRLATLMGLSGPRDLVVAEAGPDLSVPEIRWDGEAMEQAALVMRPELGQARYQGSISRRDVHAALLGVLPGIKLDAGLNWDNNSYLMDESWMTYGTQVSWNLFNVFRGPQAMEAAHAKQDVVREQRLALSMAVLMQVHLAAINHMESGRLYTLSNEYLSVQNRILEQIRAMANALEGEQALIREELNQLVAEVRRDKAYAEVQDSFGRLLVSIGVDPVPAEGDHADLSALAKAIHANITDWQHRDLRKYLGLPVLKGAASEAQALMEPEAAPDPLPTVLETASASPMPEPIPEPAPAPAPAPKTDGPDNTLFGNGDPAPEPIRLPAKTEKPVQPEPEPVATDETDGSKTADAPAILGRTLSDRVHLRNGPSLDADIMAKAAEKGEMVTILEDLGDWLHVKYKGTRGYMAARYIGPPLSKIPGRTLSDRVHLRNGPSLDADIMAKTNETGTPVTIIEDLGDWLHVQYKGKQGYMAARFIRKEAETK